MQLTLLGVVDDMAIPIVAPCCVIVSSYPVGSPLRLAPGEQLQGQEGGGQWLGECACGGVTHLALVPSHSLLVGSLLAPWGG